MDKPQQKDDGPKEFYGLQVLRAAAALAVVAGHSNDYVQAQTSVVPWEMRWMHGQAGVDIFFVISGFVMMITSERLLARPHPARTFLLRRLIRIVPLYWLLTTLKVLVVWLRPQWTPAGRPSVWNMISSYLFIPSIGASGEIRPMIPVAWTLSFEMLFYAIFAAALCLRGGRLKFLGWAIAVVALLGVARNDLWPAWTALANANVMEFLAGVWAAKWTVSGRLPGNLAAVGMVVAGCAGIALAHPGEGWTREATWGVCAVSIVVGTLALERVCGSRIPQWLLLLGDASYSIYLGQTFMFPVLHYNLEKRWPQLVHTHPLPGALLLMVFSILLISAGGVALYKLVEKPMTVGLRRLTDQPRMKTMTP